MICPLILGPVMATDYAVDVCEQLATCRGLRCALWLPEITGSPAAPTGRGNCSSNPKAPARKPEE